MSTVSGRVRSCPTCGGHPRTCHSCNIRIEFGEPKAGDAWTSQLWLTKQEFDLLLVAAAEYREINAECFHCHHGPHGQYCTAQPPDSCYCTNYVPTGEEDPVPFLDWIRPDCVEPDEQAELREARAARIAKAEKQERATKRRQVAA